LARPFEVATRRDPETRELIYYVNRVERVPLTIAAAVADILQNFQRALDHLACQLVLAAGNYPTRTTAFPIFTSLGVYRVQAGEKVRGMLPDAISAIDAIKPYRGGSDALWRLHSLASVDKQRLLKVVGLSTRLGDLTPGVLEYIRRSFSQQPYRAEVFPESPTAQAFIKSQGRSLLTKAGEVLLIDLPDAEPDDRIRFEFDLVFAEGKIASGVPVIESLTQIANTVNDIVSDFGPLLS